MIVFNLIEIINGILFNALTLNGYEINNMPSLYSNITCSSIYSKYYGLIVYSNYNLYQLKYNNNDNKLNWNKLNNEKLEI